ncbi:hypothetical protein [Escherichia albertii]
MVGGVALRDAMYPVHINVAYGSFSIEPLKCIDISQSELEFIFQHYPEQGWRAFYGVCDLWDFGYGIDDLINMGLRQRNFYVMRGHPLLRPPVFYLEQIQMLLFKRHV